ncbi:hypothetical protein [Neglectibacter caecimuris]|uniref:hypothetical protein n=1 Tax=Neglectibacter caecimuris TaxID=3093658 RepID=UPI002AC8EC88|nr:hypothetical protein [Neglectibacter sp. M00184]
MSRLSEEEIQAIMEEYKDAPMINPDKIYPPLPPVQNVTPLVRIPEPMSLTEKSAARNTPSTPISEKTGGICLECLRIFFGVAHRDMDFMMMGIGVMTTKNNRQWKSYRFKALKFKGRCGTLYLHFTIPCLLSERRTL